MQRNIIGGYDIFGHGGGLRLGCAPLGPYTAFGQGTMDNVGPQVPAPAPLAPCGPGGYPGGGYGYPWGACSPPYPACPTEYPWWRQQMGRNWDCDNWGQFQAQIAARGSALVVDNPPTTAREQFLGVQEGPLPAGATYSFVATPAQIFKPHKLVIPSDIAGAILVRNITVGNRPQLVNAAGAGALPGRMFTEVATDELVNFDTAQVSQQITLQVTNIGSSDIDVFSAGYKGVCVM